MATLLPGGCRAETALATAAPAFSIRVRPQMPDAMVRRSASLISALVRSSNMMPGYQFLHCNEGGYDVKNCAKRAQTIIISGIISGEGSCVCVQISHCAY